MRVKINIGGVTTFDINSLAPNFGVGVFGTLLREFTLLEKVILFSIMTKRSIVDLPK